MLEIVDAGAEDVLGVRLDGAVGTGEVERVFAELERRVAAHETVSGYAEVRSVAGVDWERVLREVEAGFRRTAPAGRIRRAALVTDEGWLRQGVPGHPLFRGIETRAFPLAQAEEARTWARG